MKDATKTVNARKKKRTRDPQRRQKVVDYIRENIVAGVWPRNGKLPPRTWFEKTLQAADHTVQDAFHLLISQGFLIAGRHLGTHVSAHPPHLSRYAVLLAGQEDSPTFHAQALVSAVEEMRRRGRDIDMFWDLDREFDDPAHVELFRRIADHLYAGVFLEMPPHIERTNVFLAAGLRMPVTGFFVQEQSTVLVHRSINAARPQIEQDDRVLDYLRDCGCRTVAVLRNSFAPDAAAEEICRGRLRQRGLEMPPGYFIETYHGHFAFCQAPLRLLLAQRERPVDGLIVYDDNYLPYLNRVLRETPGAAARLRVAANVNYPAVPPVDFPVRFFGI
ncbi:MAG: GntR family transcriptional regulator, partial [Planctomycetes bacterium]|nr:GntR family transcriptional regulator [Planctomycetota bacterium]